MSKFNQGRVRTAVASPIQSQSKTPDTITHQGGFGFLRDEKSELFLLAVHNMVGEQTFYESAGARDARFEGLVAAVAPNDPAWFTQFVKWLRQGANMRSASLVAALEGARAMVKAGVPGSRAMVSSALQRADEPSEALAYWFGHYGRKMPKPVKRGIADAAVRLYNERNLLKYDTDKHAFRFGDVIDLTHPEAVGIVQGALFKFALDRRHDRPVTDESLRHLGMITRNIAFRAAPVASLAVALMDQDKLLDAGMTWEDALSLGGQHKLDKRQLWEAMIPNMGYMALLRNLRNFDENGVSDEVAQQVINVLQSPSAVAKSRQLPLRFLSAYKAAPSLRWAYPLQKALDYSLTNVPEFMGRTLILVDTSGSMRSPMSERSKLWRHDAATVFGLALASRCQDATVVSFSNSTRVFDMRAGESILKAYERWAANGFFMGEGTATARSLQKHYAGHDRVVILTDEQVMYEGVMVGSVIPVHVPLYTFNLAGYAAGHTASAPTRHTVGGLTDAAFTMMALLERGHDASWPWEETGTE